MTSTCPPVPAPVAVVSGVLISIHAVPTLASRLASSQRVVVVSVFARVMFGVTALISAGLSPALVWIPSPSLMVAAVVPSLLVSE
ncbi:MAG: hypothetical protein PHU01_15155 [Desulfuromonadaceae bacterium]|nr:hypothetical protein [Desulfuromonadaceae bacterium]